MRARTAILFAVAASLVFAGCTAPGPAKAPSPGPGAPADDDTLRLAGHVLDAALRPVAGATVTVVGANAQATTDADGAFDLGRQVRGLHVLAVQAPGFLPRNITVFPDAQADALRIVLARGMPVEPYQQTFRFDGVLQCAFEAAIISPSCDSAWTAAGQDPLFGTNQSFLFPADGGWRTVVVDVAFDPEAHPGLDGLRIALRGSVDPDGGGTYDQYGRWHGSEPFTVRVEPGGNYTDGATPVPADASEFQVDVYPHSHAYHPGGQGLLGVGAATDVAFQLFVTVFYVDAAPAGFTYAL